jgi:hypothetical protein
MPQLSQQGQDSNTRALDFEHEYHDPKTFKVKPENADPLRYSQYACDLVISPRWLLQVYTSK